jgi:hypothetical protein
MRLRLELEDVLGGLQHARRADDLGRLALLTYWEVRKWARWAHQEALEELASQLVMNQPHPSRAAFLAQVDLVIQELERIRVSLH